MNIRKIILTFSFSVATAVSALADGGMYPISMIDKVPLKKAGLIMSPGEIYNPNGNGLLQAVVQIGGCTGSFVSGKGLILTNHHCAFGTLQPYSTPDNNLLEKGFLAADGSKELPAKGLTCKIMESHKDVSEDVLKGTENATDAQAKKSVMDVNIANIKKAEQQKNPEMQIEISEMLPGKNYILFRYKTLKDIRIVYIPARNIGEFGGESDNWVWPRHTGDFSFLRAYVSRDGKGTTYDQKNVPYEPKEHLNINENGVDEGDFVMILGYPGRTYRNQPAEFVGMHQKYQLPYIADLFRWQINTIKELGKSNEAWMIKQEPRIKSLANTQKNFTGKIKSLNGLDLYRKRLEEEKQLVAMLGSNPAMQKSYQRTIKSIDSLYSLSGQSYTKYLWYNQLSAQSPIIGIASAINSYNQEYALVKNDAEKLNKLKTDVIATLRTQYSRIYMPFDTTYLAKMLYDGFQFKEGNTVQPLKSVFSPKCTPQTVYLYVREATRRSKILDSSYVIGLINSNSKKTAKLKDPFLNLSRGLYAEYYALDSVQTKYKTQLDDLLPRYVDARMAALGQQFIPDANSTMRLTYGYIKGYSPADATYYQPQTTVAGMLEKGGQSHDYEVNEILARVYKQNKTTPFYSAKLKDIPSSMLYNTDTSGGNSGSPVLNKYGQLIGLNFDRAYEATVNDYAWDDAYSRSIGLDIRFVLWTTQEVAGAKYLIDEMFIDKNK